MIGGVVLGPVAIGLLLGVAGLAAGVLAVGLPIYGAYKLGQKIKNRSSHSRSTNIETVVYRFGFPRDSLTDLRQGGVDDEIWTDVLSRFDVSPPEDGTAQPTRPVDVVIE